MSDSKQQESNLQSNRYRTSIEQCTLGFLTWYENQIDGLYTEQIRSPDRFTPIHSHSMLSSTVIAKTNSSVVYRYTTFAYKHVMLSQKEKRLAYLRMAIRELWYLHNLRHPCLLSATRSQILMQHGRIYRMIHEFPLANGTLELLIAEGYVLTKDECRTIMSVLIHAVNHMHLHGIVHGDIKASNMFKLGSVWKLGDFSLSTHLNEQSIDIPMGSTGWAAPELDLSETKYTCACDVWSIGAVARYLYQRVPDSFLNKIMDMCLKYDPVDRVKMVELLELEGIVKVPQPTVTNTLPPSMVLKLSDLVPVDNVTDYKDEKLATLQNMLCETYLESTGKLLSRESIMCQWGSVILQRILNKLYTLKATYQIHQVLKNVLDTMRFVWQGHYDELNHCFESELYHVLTLSGFYVPI